MPQQITSHGNGSFTHSSHKAAVRFLRSSDKMKINVLFGAWHAPHYKIERGTDLYRAFMLKCHIGNPPFISFVLGEVLCFAIR